MGDGVSDLVRRGEGWAGEKQKREAFEKDLAALLNCWNIDAETDTPDFILAEMLFDQIQAYRNCQRALRRWRSQQGRPE